MTAAELQNAIGQHLIAMPNCVPVVWPNKDASLPIPPYVVVDFVPASRSDKTLGGQATVDEGYLMASLVTELDAFASEGLALAQAIADRFPMALRLSVTGGEVLIVKPSDVKQGFRDGPYWRTPVKVTYRAA